jgi:DNA recombination protein Rad52
MMFSDIQKQQLAAGLISNHIKTRSQGGREVSYIEGWHVIAEANRIFGFDAWSRETVDLKCVSERERTIGGMKTPGWGVTYIARVRIRVGDIIREGCGTGHGIDRDLGQAHESALKEAETDSMKRALMTFGNPFGLALYDKAQAGVVDEPAQELCSNPPPVDDAALATAFNSDDLRGLSESMIQNINKCTSIEAIDILARSAENKDNFSKLPPVLKAAVAKAASVHRGNLTAKATKEKAA